MFWRGFQQVIQMLFAVFAAHVFVAEVSAGERGRYDHVIRVTAQIDFSGQIIEVDDLIDCKTSYAGPANRAIDLPFQTLRWQLPYRTTDAGVLIINIMPNACSAFAKNWSGVENPDAVFPDGWIPFMHWYDRRDPLEAVYGEYFWSHTGLMENDGRLTVTRNFQVTYPQQSKVIESRAAQQARERDVWITEQPRISSAIFLPRLPVFFRLGRETWAGQPAYVMSDVSTDYRELSGFLDQLPQGSELMFLGEEFGENPDWGLIIEDHLRGHRGGVTDGWHGVPQRGVPKWGLFLSDRAFERAQEEIWRVPFRDNWVPTELVNGTLTLQPGKVGRAFLHAHYSDWYHGERDFDFLQKAFVNGPYTAEASLFIFDLETRDLWVRG